MICLIKLVCIYTLESFKRSFKIHLKNLRYEKLNTQKRIYAVTHLRIIADKTFFRQLYLF